MSEMAVFEYNFEYLFEILLIENGEMKGGENE